MTFSEAYIIFVREMEKHEQAMIDNPEDEESKVLFDAFDKIDILINHQIPALVNGCVNLMEILGMYHETSIQDS